MAKSGFVRLSVLGALDLRWNDGCPVTGLLVQPKRLALLVFLLVDHPGCYRRRDALLPIFWPEADEEHARNALSRALFVIRQHLGPRAVQNRGVEEVSVSPELVHCDATDFREAMVSGDFAAAIDLYGGPFLDGFHLRGVGPIQRWIEDARSEFQGSFARAARRVAREAEESNDLDGAEATWRRLLAIDPGNSDALLGVMRTLVGRGARTEAITAAGRHVDFLRNEFGLEPDMAVSGFLARLRAGPP